VNVLSLCSGIGGLDLGLTWAGMTIAGQVEIDPWCRSVLAAHWPGVPRHDDIRTAAAWWTSAPRPAIDLICGGIPCQPHSAVGRRLGVTDPRWLWPPFAHVVAALRPALVLIENVPRFTRSGLADVLRDLAALGFDAWWSRVPAAAFGAPHLRWRLFVVAAHPDRAGPSFQPWRSSGQSWEDQAHTGWDGTVWSLASHRRRHPAIRGSNSGTPGRNTMWETEPAMGRVADGSPAGVDRLHGLGNAVVPQVAEYVADLIAAACLPPVSSATSVVTTEVGHIKVNHATSLQPQNQTVRSIARGIIKLDRRTPLHLPAGILDKPRHLSADLHVAKVHFHPCHAWR
jgi:DNA (cytosine-5)-methyltransferase 1